MNLSEVKEKLAAFFQFKKIKEFIRFLTDVASDSRIPATDKKVLLGLLALVISPLDLIPDWIPVIGQIDDAIMIALILDYLFEVLDEEIILSHYPWDPKSFETMKKIASYTSKIVPVFLKKLLWKYAKVEK